jgi:DUF1680 family protein
MPHSRRDALRLLGAGAACASLPAAPAAAGTTGPAGPLAAGWFPLSAVRLGEGPFLAAQRLDAAYLLQLEPDRMLHNFRLNAGLTPKAPVYGGWESVEPWIDIRCHGHTLGHYLTAASCMFESTGDVRFAERVDYLVAELAECQAKTGGWLTAFPDGVAPLTDSLAGKPFAGVPWYTTHKVLAGLRDAYLHRGSESARDVFLAFCEWIDRECAGISDERFQKMLDREHGGMTDVLIDAHFVSGVKSRYLELARRFAHRALLEPLAAGRDALDGLHANTQIPKVIGFSRLEGADPTLAGNGYSKAAKFFWSTVVNERSYATGGHGDVEHFFPKNEFAKRLGSGKTMETCCTHNMMALTRNLYGGDPRVEYFDYYERALFNGILASQDPQTGMNSYFQSTRPGYVRLYHTPFDSFWCCTGSGIENHARYGESIYARGDDSTVYVNLFIASTLDWRDAGIGLTQQTRFPDEDTTRLVVGGVAQRYTIALRQPAWCPVMSVSVNGRKKTVRRPGQYFFLTRRFSPGDTIDVRLPMSLALEPLPDPAGGGEWAALRFGPIVLAGRMGTAGLTPGSQLIVNERKSGEMLNEPVTIPSWSRPLAELLASTARVDGASLRFIARGFEGGATVELIPWFRATNERYNLYWRRSSGPNG